MSARSAASSPSGVGPLFAGSHSPDVCARVLPAPAPGASVLAAFVGGPAPPVFLPPPLPAITDATDDDYNFPVKFLNKWSKNMSDEDCRT